MSESLSKQGSHSGSRLSISQLVAGYGGTPTLRGIDLAAESGQISLLIGHNGSGKSTVLKSILGIAHTQAGTIEVDGRSLLGQPTRRRVADGVGYVPQTLGVFPRFSVSQCLDLGGYLLKSRSLTNERKDMVYDLFPVLREHCAQPSSLLSGGEQRLLMVGMALMLRPRLLLVDEPSAGLAPVRVAEVMQQLRRLPGEFDMAVLLVEQNIAAGLEIADRVYVLKDGKVAARMSPDELRARETFWDLV